MRLLFGVIYMQKKKLSGAEWVTLMILVFFVSAFLFVVGCAAKNYYVHTVLPTRQTDTIWSSENGEIVLSIEEDYDAVIYFEVNGVMQSFCFSGTTVDAEVYSPEVFETGIETDEARYERWMYKKIRRDTFTVEVVESTFFEVGEIIVFEKKRNSTVPCITEATDATVAQNAEIVEEADYFRITKKGTLFYYELYGDDHNVVVSNGPYTKAPEIIMVENQLMRTTIQAGTGIETQFGFYYDVETGATSSIYDCIFDQACGLVAYATYNKIFVRDIFDEQGFYQEIATFEHPFSKVAFPFTDVRFSEDGCSVYVTFLSGPEYTEVTEEISLRKTGDGSPS